MFLTTSELRNILHAGYYVIQVKFYINVKSLVTRVYQVILFIFKYQQQTLILLILSRSS